MREQIKFFSVPLAIVAGWLILCALSLASVSRPVALQESIDKVLAGHVVEEPKPAAQPIASASGTSSDDQAHPRSLRASNRR